MVLTRFAYKEEYSFEQRKEEALKVMSKFPDRIPVIVERIGYSKAPIMETRKLLVPDSLGSSYFSLVMKKRLALGPDSALFMYINGILVSHGITMGQLHKLYKEEDDFLYISYGTERAFG